MLMAKYANARKCVPPELSVCGEKAKTGFSCIEVSVEPIDV